MLLRSAAMEVTEETGLCEEVRLKYSPSRSPRDPTLSSSAAQDYPQLGQGLCSPILTSLWVTWALGKGRVLGEGGSLQQSQFQKRSGSQVRSCGSCWISWYWNHSLGQATCALCLDDRPSDHRWKFQCKKIILTKDPRPAWWISCQRLRNMAFTPVS